MTGGTPVRVSDNVSMVLRAIAPVVNSGVRWEYDLLIGGVRVIREDDLVTSVFGPETASRVLAGTLVSDLESGEREWPREIQEQLSAVRADLEGWGGVEQGRR